MKPPTRSRLFLAKEGGNMRRVERWRRRLVAPAEALDCHRRFVIASLMNNFQSLHRPVGWYRRVANADWTAGGTEDLIGSRTPQTNQPKKKKTKKKPKKNKRRTGIVIGNFLITRYCLDRGLARLFLFFYNYRFLLGVFRYRVLPSFPCPLFF